MKISTPHPWPTDYTRAVALQNELREKIALRPLPRGIRLVAGTDVSYDRHSDLMHAGVVVMRLPDFEIVEERSVSLRVPFPYIPGLLTFREAPPLIEVFRQIDHVPDAVLVDGQGIAHMRGIGLAAHLGLLIGIPTVGCAKSRLVGEHRELTPLRRGRRTPLRYDRRIVGSVLCTRDGVKPLYISPGHLSDIPSCVRLVLRCTKGVRLPEPIRAAHALVNRVRTAKGHS